MAITLSLEKTKTSLVPEYKIKSVLQNYGLIVEPKENTGEEIIYLSTEGMVNETPAKCSGCGSDMKINNFGHLAKGSTLIYCKNPKCFHHYLALKKIKMVSKK